mmetsp:Transcript_79272/g.229264  ORF Transcript_79272/g.229264 Transcript_79272/m.229264 type:complete len:228 (+) Transcript_79272:2534-3217(+)
MCDEILLFCVRHDSLQDLPRCRLGPFVDQLQQEPVVHRFPTAVNHKALEYAQVLENAPHCVVQERVVCDQRACGQQVPVDQRDDPVVDCDRRCAVGVTSGSLPQLLHMREDRTPEQGEQHHVRVHEVLQVVEYQSDLWKEFLEVRRGPQGQRRGNLASAWRAVDGAALFSGGTVLGDCLGGFQGLQAELEAPHAPECSVHLRGRARRVTKAFHGRRQGPRQRVDEPL